MKNVIVFRRDLDCPDMIQERSHFKAPHSISIKFDNVYIWVANSIGQILHEVTVNLGKPMNKNN